MKALLATLGVALVATAALAATAPAAPTQQRAMNDTIVGVAASDARFSTLVTLVKKAGLVGTLSAKGPYTVFAPTNAAFAKLKKTAPKTYAAVASDKALLKKVLTYHVLAKKVAEPGRRRRRETECLGQDSRGREDQAVPQGRQALPERKLPGNRRRRRRVQRRHPRDQHGTRAAQRRLIQPGLTGPG